MLGSYSGLIYIFVNIYDLKARCAFLSYARFLIRITSIFVKQHEVALIGTMINLLLLCNKSFDQKLPDALALAGVQVLPILCLYQSRDKQLMNVM